MRAISYKMSQYICWLKKNWREKESENTRPRSDKIWSIAIQDITWIKISLKIIQMTAQVLMSESATQILAQSLASWPCMRLTLFACCTRLEKPGADSRPWWKETIEQTGRKYNVMSQNASAAIEKQRIEKERERNFQDKILMLQNQGKIVFVQLEQMHLRCEHGTRCTNNAVEIIRRRRIAVESSPW